LPTTQPAAAAIAAVPGLVAAALGLALLAAAVLWALARSRIRDRSARAWDDKAEPDATALGSRPRVGLSRGAERPAAPRLRIGSAWTPRGDDPAARGARAGDPLDAAAPTDPDAGA
jgi:hypothetical protein